MEKDKALNKVLFIGILSCITTMIFIIIGKYLANDFGIYLQNIAMIYLMIGLSCCFAYIVIKGIDYYYNKYYNWTDFD